jgi:fumarate hydratase class II
MPTRIEHDTFGPIDVPSERLWGAQPQRSLRNFDISGERQPREIIRALVQVKRASALVNQQLGLLDVHVAGATVAAAGECGNDVAVNFGGASGNFELNVFRPMIAHNFQ